MIVYEEDVGWLLNHAKEGKEGSYVCIFTDEKIVFDRIKITTLALNIKVEKFINRPYCPACDPKKTHLKPPKVAINKRDLHIVPPEFPKYLPRSN